MSPKLSPTDPAASMAIRHLSPNIITCSSPFWRFGRISVGGRGTLVKLRSGSIAVFSPVALTPDVRSAIESLGNKVSYIAALDIEHHVFISEWAKAYPEAALLGPDGLAEKRAKNPATRDHSSFKYIWTNANKHNFKVTEEFDAEFDYEFVGAHLNKELVFYYKPEKTLIQADLLWNLPATEQFSKVPEENLYKGFSNRLALAVLGARGNAIWQKRFLWYGGSSGNRPDFNKSVGRIATWDIQRIIPCHGDVIDNDAQGVFRKVFDWHLNAIRNTSPS